MHLCFWDYRHGLLLISIGCHHYQGYLYIETSHAASQAHAHVFIYFHFHPRKIRVQLVSYLVMHDESVDTSNV